MAVINTSAVVFVGQGSEWFWQALSGIAVLVTLLAIYRQLRSQVRTEALEQVRHISKEWWGHEPMMRRQLAVAEETLDALINATEPAGLTNAGIMVAAFWEQVGSLSRAGQYDVKRMYEWMGIEVCIWWSVLEPSIQVERESFGDRRGWENFQWLNERLAKFAADDQVTMPVITLEMVEWNVSHFRANVEFEMASRTIPVAAAVEPRASAPPEPAPTQASGASA